MRRRARKLGGTGWEIYLGHAVRWRNSGGSLLTLIGDDDIYWQWTHLGSLNGPASGEVAGLVIFVHRGARSFFTIPFFLPYPFFRHTLFFAIPFFSPVGGSWDHGPPPDPRSSDLLPCLPLWARTRVGRSCPCTRCDRRTGRWRHRGRWRGEDGQVTCTRADFD